MIIDTHIHIGNMMNFSLSLELVKNLMKKNNIARAILSSIDATEVDHNQVIIKENAKSQIELNQELLDLVKDDDRFGVLIWCKPLTEGWNKEFEKFLLANLDRIKGLKFHPFHSALKITDKRVQPYLEFANKYRLCVKVHCADDKHSRSKYVYQVAKKYPKAKFIMAHLELGGDYKSAREYLIKQNNLYADTAWLPFKEVIKIIEAGGQEKIMFGTDCPIDGNTHYDFYHEYFNYDSIDKIGLENYYLLMSNNAKKVYGI